MNILTLRRVICGAVKNIFSDYNVRIRSGLDFVEVTSCLF